MKDFNLKTFISKNPLLEEHLIKTGRYKDFIKPNKMKKSELRQIIKEEIRKVLNEEEFTPRSNATIKKIDVLAKENGFKQVPNNHPSAPQKGDNKTENFASYINTKNESDYIQIWKWEEGAHWMQDVNVSWSVNGHSGQHKAEKATNPNWWKLVGQGKEDNA